eukprot:357102-Chlamydomonas_euryale.AAC.5
MDRQVARQRLAAIVVVAAAAATTATATAAAARAAAADAAAGAAAGSAAAANAIKCKQLRLILQPPGGLLDKMHALARENNKHGKTLANAAKR